MGMDKSHTDLKNANATLRDNAITITSMVTRFRFLNSMAHLLPTEQNIHRKYKNKAPPNPARSAPSL